MRVGLEFLMFCRSNKNGEKNDSFFQQVVFPEDHQFFNLLLDARGIDLEMIFERANSVSSNAKSLDEVNQELGRAGHCCCFFNNAQGVIVETAEKRKDGEINEKRSGENTNDDSKNGADNTTVEKACNIGKHVIYHC